MGNGIECVGFSVSGDDGGDLAVLRLHPKQEHGNLADREPIASIALKREQIIDLVVWLTKTLSDRMVEKTDA